MNFLFWSQSIFNFRILNNFAGFLLASFGWLFLVLFIVGAAHAAPSPELQSALISLQKKYPQHQYGIELYNLRSSKTIWALNSTLNLKPASTQKLLVTALALKQLGQEYRFKTRFIVSKSKLGQVLTVLPGGDPFLTTEEIWLAVRELKLSGIKNISEIVLVTGELSNGAALTARGLRAFESAATPLAVNFNSLAIHICPGKIGAEAWIQLDPEEGGHKLNGRVITQNKPTNISASIEGAVFSVGGSIKAGEPCRKIYRAVKNPTDYFLSVLKGLLSSAGILNANVQLKTSENFPNIINSSFTYEHKSKPLSQILHDLNHYSNNFIAEELLFNLDNRGRGLNSRAVGLKTLSAYAAGLIEAGARPEVFDSSGLSHANRISAKALTALLIKVYSDKVLLADFVSSLPLGGRSGTLKDRNFKLPSGDLALVRAKTGSIAGVSALAGYIKSQSGDDYAFSILQNSVKMKDAAIKFEQDFVKIVYRLG